ncbi:MAG: NADH-quinone oxidoreductase subunit L [Acidobacteriia bacterium]|nr:NADH-quinone oxidoreductase subunit L [Terriglobia bacterium]
MNLHVWLIPVLPLVGAAVNGLFGRHYSKKVVAAVGLAFVGLAFLWSVYAAIQFGNLPHDQLPYIETHLPWIQAGDFRADFGFYLDQLSLVMILVVSGVGFVIHIYSVGYMWEEGGFYRYFSYLNLFMFFMLTLVLANNYLLMFVGWEGVGLASYLLIGFFFLRDSAASAGKKAFIVNRIGDFGFLIALFLLIKHFGSLNYAEVFGAASHLTIEPVPGVLTAIAILMMVGAAGKSAQVPLYVWLPDAMEGPTPVSALIHAATMVTAGVYMVCRSNPIFSRSPEAMLVVAVVGCFTAFFAATIGMAQTDIKRVLAYSTVSQLGYMFLAAGVAAYSAAIFHLMTHAFFKALLFLAAGSVIHGLGGQQDMRNMGGLKKYMPVTFWTMTAATFAIAGFFPLSGFFSKDEILWQAYSSRHGHWLLWLIATVTALMTSFYMFRLWFLTFFGEYRGVEGAGHGQAPGQPIPEEARSAEPAVTEDSAEILIPAEYEKLVLREVKLRHGTVIKVEQTGDSKLLKATFPKGRMMYLEQDVKKVSNGRGTATLRFTDVVRASRPAAAPPPVHHGPHESPWVMLGPLVVLAIGSVIAGWIGWPQALGGSNHFEHFLSPAIQQVEQTAAEGHVEAASTEIAFMLISLGASALGLFFAWLLYYKRRELPAKITVQLGGLYDAVRNKYWVDEGYNTLFVQPLIEGSTRLLWRAIDVGAIDRSVNEAAEGAQALSGEVRQMQSGNIRSYAGWVAAGAAVALLYMIWAGGR